jgi:hypothetical protein
MIAKSLRLTGPRSFGKNASPIRPSWFRVCQPRQLLENASPPLRSLERSTSGRCLAESLSSSFVARPVRCAQPREQPGATPETVTRGACRSTCFDTLSTSDQRAGRLASRGSRALTYLTKAGIRRSAAFQGTRHHMRQGVVVSHGGLEGPCAEPLRSSPRI